LEQDTQRRGKNQYSLTNGRQAYILQRFSIIGRPEIETAGGFCAAGFSSSPIKENKAMSEWEPKIVAFLCNWCSYGAADLAGVGRMEYPSNIRVVRIPCTGRMDPKFSLAALREGADGVWVSG
jgi:hypothetical protein